MKDSHKPFRAHGFHDLLLNDYIICNLTALNKIALVWSNHARHDCLHSIGHAFSNHFITHNAQANRPKLRDLFWMNYFRNKNQRSNKHHSNIQGEYLKSNKLKENQ